MPDLSGKILEGKYELIKLIGEGGMGAVYEAKHKLIGRRLAVKFLHSQFTSNEEVVLRFQREAQAAAAIGHDNIIEVTDMGQTPDGAPFLVMEYLNGFDVRHLLKQNGALSIEEAAEIMVQSLSALQAAHNAGIIHRDLKPENIFLIDKFECKRYVKLLDFGISKFRTLDGKTKGLTQTGTVLGTPYYMSPEQASGTGDIGIKSDIYSMGVILFQMVTGRLPFDAANYNALLVKILTEDPPDPLDFKPDLPADIVSIIRTAMAKRPEDRFNDCSEFREYLLSYVPGASSRFHTMTAGSKTAVQSVMSTHTPLEMTRSRGPVEAKRGKWPLILGGVATLVLAAVLGGFLFSDPEKETTQFGSTQMDLTVQKTPANTGIGTVAANTVPATSTEAEPKKIRLQIAAEPSTARIAVDGVVGANPYDNIVYKDDRSHKVDITADGYKVFTADVVFNRDQDLTFKLEKLEGAEEVVETLPPAPAPDIPVNTHVANQQKEVKQKRNHTSERWVRRNANRKPKDKKNDKLQEKPRVEITKKPEEPKPAAPASAEPPKDNSNDSKSKKRKIDLNDPWQNGSAGIVKKQFSE